MGLLFDFIPVILFFIAYPLYGIYVATGIVIVASILQVAYTWFRHRKVDGLLLTSASLVVLLGTTTLLAHNAIFIKWKPTVIYWVFALAFLASEYLFSGRSLIQRMLDSSISLPQAVWHKLNIGWVCFFSVMGAINLYIIYHFSTRFWVTFKLFGVLGFTLVFIILQSVYVAKHLQNNDAPTDRKPLS
jgi:intracellular septation protein